MATLRPEHAEVIKDQVKGALASLTPDQIGKLALGAFAFGMVAAEMLLNQRVEAIEALEKVKGGGKK